MAFKRENNAPTSIEVDLTDEESTGNTGPPEIPKPPSDMDPEYEGDECEYKVDCAVEENTTDKDLKTTRQPVETIITENGDMLTSKSPDDMNPKQATDTDHSASHRQNTSVPIQSRESPREIRLSMGPYAVFCPDHYVQHHYVPDESGTGPVTVSNNYNGLSEYSSDTEQRQTLFLPSSPNGFNMIVDKVNVDNSASENDDMNQPANEEMEDYDYADIHHQLNPPYISRSLVEVENATKNWYLSEQNRNLSVSQPTETTDFFSLQFNETSLSTIALWVAGGPKRKCGLNTTLYRPIVDTRFRVCCICHRFGHYEVECQRIRPEQTMKFSQWMTNGENGDEGTPSTTNDVFQKKYDITVEMCDGYLIEQRSQEEVQDVRFSKVGKPTAANMASEGFSGPNIIVHAATTCTSRQFEIDDIVIQEGETLESLSQQPTSYNGSALPSPMLDNKQARINKGCLVTWSVNMDGTCTDFPGVLAVGTVAEVDTDAGRVRVQVNFLQTIEPKINGITRQRELPNIDTLIWVPAKFLYYVDGRNYLLPTDNIPVRKKRKYTKVTVARKAKTHDKPATTKLKNTGKRHLAHRLQLPARPERVEVGPSKLARVSKRGKFCNVYWHTVKTYYGA